MGLPGLDQGRLMACQEPDAHGFLPGEHDLRHQFGAGKDKGIGAGGICA